MTAAPFRHTYGLRGEGLVWLIGAVVCLLAANRGCNCSLTRAMDGRIVRWGFISSRQSAATSETVKRFVAYSCKKRYSKYRTFIFFTFSHRRKKLQKNGESS